MDDYDYEVVTNGEGWRVRYRARPSSFWDWLFPPRWLWFEEDVSCGFAGTDTQIREFGTHALAVEAMREEIAADRRRNALRAHGWKVVESAATVDAVDPSATSTGKLSTRV